MGKILKQFRYYGEESPAKDLNYPSSINKATLDSGEVFFDNSMFPTATPTSIASLGIQTIPGVKFYLNSATDPIIVGSSGIYELNLTDNYEILYLDFDPQSLDLIGSYNGDAYLIVDIVYNTEG